MRIIGRLVLVLALGVASLHCGDSDNDVTDTGSGADVIGDVGDEGQVDDPGLEEDPGVAVDPGFGDQGQVNDPGLEEDAGGDVLVQEQRYLESDQFASLVSPDLVSANNKFAVKLFKALAEDELATSNMFVSPLSVSTALSMVYWGATGDTRSAMAETLEYAGIDSTVLDLAWQNLIFSLENVDDDVVLAIADSIWTRDEFEPYVEDAFLSAMGDVFDAELFTKDFSAVETLGEINGWVEDNTNGKIKNLLEQIPADAVMYLINALYFKADWLYPFDSAETGDQTFTLADGTEKTVDMMKFPEMVTSFKYTADDDYCVLRMPYGRDMVAFYGIIPWSWDSEKTIEDFIADMTAEQLEGYFSAVTLSSGMGDGITVWMPKFKIEFKKTLNSALIALGMEPAFDIGGFEGIAPGIGISQVIHQTFIEVNEEGTEAAAATAIEMVTGIMPSFVATKPFFFVIRDDRSGQILFMGKVADPSYEE